MTDSEEDDGRIPLAASIKALRGELEEAIRVGRDEELQFGLGPVEMEFQLGATKTGGGTAGVQFWVLSLGAKGEIASSTTQRIKLTLTPLDKEGNTDVRVTSDDDDERLD
jgi:hypothetical protein